MNFKKIYYEGLGRGFGQGLFDKDSVLTSKPVNPEPEEVKDRYVLIEVDGGDEYFIENIEPVRRLEPGPEAEIYKTWVDRLKRGPKERHETEASATWEHNYRQGKITKQNVNKFQPG